MKPLFIVCLAIISFCTVAFSFQTSKDGLFWETNFENAVAKAKKDKKKILVNFTGSDWCGWCIRLDTEVFSKGEFVTYANETFVCVKLDFPKDKSKTSDAEKKQNQELAMQYKVRGFPTILLLDADKNLVMETGYQSGGAKTYIDHLNEGMKKK